MQQDELARKIAAKSASLKRTMDKAEKVRSELCALLTEAAHAACASGEISAVAEGDVIAPKDEGGN